MIVMIYLTNCYIGVRQQLPTHIMLIKLLMNVKQPQFNLFREFGKDVH